MILLLGIIKPSRSQKLVILQVVHHPSNLNGIRIQQPIGGHVVRSDLNTIAPTAVSVLGRNHFLNIAEDIEHCRMVRHPRTVANRHNGTSGLRPSVSPHQILAILFGVGQQRRCIGMANRGQLLCDRLQTVAILSIIEVTIRVTFPVGRHARRHQAVFWHFFAVQIGALGLRTLRNDPFAPLDQGRCILFEPFPVATSSLMFGQRPKMFAGAAERVAGGQKSLVVIAFQEELKPTSGEISVPAHIHAADHGLRLAFQRSINHRSNPRCNTAAPLLIPGRRHAMHLGRQNHILQQRIGNIDLHGSRKLLFPKSFDLLGPTGRAAQHGIVSRLHGPKRQIDDQPSRFTRRQLSADADAVILLGHTQRRRLPSIVIRQHTPAGHGQQTVFYLLNGVENLRLAIDGRKRQFKSNLSLGRLCVLDRVFHHADSPMPIPTWVSFRRLFVDRGHIGALPIRNSVFLYANNRLGQPSAVEMPRNFALAAAEFRHNLRIRLVGRLPPPLARRYQRGIIAVRRIVNVKTNHTITLDHQLSIIAPQRKEHRPVLLNRIVRLGHRLREGLIGHRAHLLQNGLLARNLLQILRQRHTRRINRYKQPGAGNIHAALRHDVFHSHADRLLGQLKPQYGAVALVRTRLAVTHFQLDRP